MDILIYLVAPVLAAMVSSAILQAFWPKASESPVANKKAAHASNIVDTMAKKPAAGEKTPHTSKPKATPAAIDVPEIDEALFQLPDDFYIDDYRSNRE